ncbi:MAG: TonB-dependent receptor [Prevotellaceae bacterium]|jgi:TonB-linked SusC/RagA family outer membrane protein|nr:TonB-dependent receptor [Prevotellaceae bacterium]
MKNTLKKITLLFVMCGFIANVSAQEKRTISGKVSDQNNEALIGATVLEQGTSNGTVTDYNGQFQLSVSDGAILSVTYTGHEKVQEKVSAGKDVYNFTLVANSRELDEVVATGYGFQKRSEITGSISSVRANDVKDFSSKSLAESLGGMAAGVMVTKNSGAPGEEADIMIRGLGSVNGMKPLYIVDGVAQGAGFNFNMRDVESIEILKDAGSAAIYGARAAGGVILITTKKGGKGTDCAGNASITANARVGLRNVNTNIKLLNRDEFIRAKGLSNQNGIDGVLAGYGVSDINELPDVDWFKLLYGTGIEQEYNIAVSGGNQKIKFYLSGSYYGEKGTFIDTWAKRFSIRNSLEYSFNKHITIGESLYGSLRTSNPSRPGEFANTIPFFSYPIIDPIDENDNWGKLSDNTNRTNLYGNEMVYHSNYDKGYTLNAQIFANIMFVDGLDWRTTVAGEFYGESYNRFTESYDFGQDKNPNKSMDAGGNTSQNLTFNSTLTYDTKKLLGNHNIKIMVGTEILQYDRYGVDINAIGFPVPTAETVNLSGSAYDKKAWDGRWRNRVASFFGRINYSYAGKYLLTANLRYDGSDKFGPRNKWGLFPSVNVGWRLSEEKFIKDNLDWLDNAKIRASYGILGNDQIPQFLYSAEITNAEVKYTFGDKETYGFELLAHPNENIRWESVHQLDFGVDFAFLKQRLNITYDYYNRQTSGMLYSQQVPLTSGVRGPNGYYATITDQMLGGIMTNAGQMQNTGHEISVTWADKTSFGLKYSIGVNGSFNKNVMKNFAEVEGEGKPYDAILYGWGNQSSNRTADGYPVALFYGYKVNGIFATQEQVDDYNRSAFEKTGGLVSHYQEERTGVGDLIYADINGDGRITDADRTFIGNPWPKAILGLNLAFEFKGIDLSMNFQGAFGFDIFNAVKTYTQSFSGENTTADFFNASFLGENGLTNQPRVGYWQTLSSGRLFWYGDGDCNKNYSQISSYFVEKGDYLKLKNLVIGYTLPQKALKKIKMQQLRIYMSAQNLFTITKYTGIDPEIGETKDPVSGASTSMQRGVDTYNRYLPSRLFSFGIDLTF